MPCGKCIGCHTAAAKAWALRCTLENQLHQHAAFTTLTYDEKHLPPTLRKRDLQLWLKRFREALGPTRPIRFFASGEYGEQSKRPHYHALLFGAAPADYELIKRTWKMGHTHTVPITPAAINYVAGYTTKKLTDKDEGRRERVDPETGEVYEWQPPFIQMSRRPGIGGHARQHTASWRSYAINNGVKTAVPRFLHEAWKQQATEEQREQLAKERELKQQQQPTTLEDLDNKHIIHLDQQKVKAARRRI